MIPVVLFAAVLFIAYANGANDNFKGVATLFGSGTFSYRFALGWATGVTLLGSLTAMLLAGQLLKSFSGKGLVEASLVGDPRYAAAVAFGAGLTVLLATKIGMPISTTHGLVGALIGAGLAAGSAIHIERLGAKFVLPLLLSPVLAIVVTGLLYPVFRFLRRRTSVTESTCFCVGSEIIERAPSMNAAAAVERAGQLQTELSIEVDDAVNCQRRYEGRVLGFAAAPALDVMHVLSAGAVSFARGLNDTPKMAALLLLLPAISGVTGLALVGAAIALGGLISAGRVAETMSHKITKMNSGQGFTANLVTSAVVIGASRFGLPVSTTHVSCGSLFGVGVATGGGHWRTIGAILGSWLLTLPCGALFGAIGWWASSQLT